MEKLINNLRFKIFIIIVDAVILFLGYFISFYIRFGQRHNSLFLVINFFPVYLTIFIISLIFNKCYPARFIDLSSIFKRVFRVGIITTLVCFAILYSFRERYISYPSSMLLIPFLINTILLFAVRVILYDKYNKLLKKVIFLKENDLKEVLKKNNDDIDEIVIDKEIDDVEEMSFLINFSQERNIKLFVSPNLYYKYINKKITNDFNFNFSYYSIHLNFVQELFINMLDFVISISAIFLLLPLIIMISFLIKLDSSGPIIYKQERIGKDGRKFFLYKFRTMIKDAEKNTGPVLASCNDARVTKVGRILRKIRFDELPQLFNVIKGDMSLVGPRPERPYFVKLHKALQGVRLAIKPGITGFAQIRGSYDLKPVHKLKYDYLYIQKRSLFLNIYILIKTLPVIFLRKGW